MEEETAAGREFQRYMVAAINGERSAQGMTIRALAQRSGMNERTLLRVLKLERSLDFAQIDVLARAMNVPVSRLVMEAERRRAENRTHEPERIKYTHAQIVGMLADPASDPWLTTQLGELSRTGTLTERLRAEVLSVRREQLTVALEGMRSNRDSTG